MNNFGSCEYPFLRLFLRQQMEQTPEPNFWNDLFFRSLTINKIMSGGSASDLGNWSLTAKAGKGGIVHRQPARRHVTSIPTSYIFSISSVFGQ